MSGPMNDPTRMMQRSGSWRVRGFTMVEFLVSVAMGLIILAAVAVLFAATVRGNTETLRSARLNQDLTTVLDIIANDLRRAGYTGGQVTYDDISDPSNPVHDVNLPNSACVLYSYNRNQDAAIDDNEWLGFKLKSGAIEMRDSCNSGDSTCSTDCSAGSWEAVTDINVVNITNLRFYSTGSKCLNLVTDSYWETTGASATGFPCAADSAAGLDIYEIDTSTSPPYSYATTTTFTAPLTDERTVETRQVTLTLAGELAYDSTVKKQVAAQIKIRNDKVRTHL